MVREHADAILARDAGALTDARRRVRGDQGGVVAADPEERTGLRATLNYGHTLAHALETVGGYELLHGEAVAVGLVFAERAGRCAGADRCRAPSSTTATSSSRSTCRSRSLAPPTPTRCSRSCAATRRRWAVSPSCSRRRATADIVLETVHDPDRRALDVAFAAVGVRRLTAMATILLLSGPNLNLFGQRDPRDLRHRHPRRHGRRRSRRRAGPRARARARAVEPRGRSRRRGARRARPVRGHRDQPRRVRPLQLRDRRRAPDLRRGEGRAARVEPECTRGMARGCRSSRPS